jgi:hypothetical protein
MDAWRGVESTAESRTDTVRCSANTVKAPSVTPLLRPPL